MQQLWRRGGEFISVKAEMVTVIKKITFNLKNKND